MSQVTELATTQINTTAAVTVELVEAEETPAVVIVTWPVKATVLHPRRFPDAAAVMADVRHRQHRAFPDQGREEAVSGPRVRPGGFCSS